MDTARTVTTWAALIPLWIVQYVVWVPVVWVTAATWRVVRFGTRIGLFGLLLVFLPVIGWIILGFIYMGRRNDARHAELMASLQPVEKPTRSLTTPWLKHLIV